MRIRMYRSCLSKEEAQKLMQRSKNIEPCYGKITDLSTDEVVKLGSERMAKDGFKISSAVKDDRTL